MFLDDIKAYLISEGISGAITIDAMPDSPDDVVGLFAYGGSDPEVRLEVEYPRMQVRSRSLSGATAFDKLKTIQSKLHGKSELLINNVRYMSVRAIQEPTPIGKDEKGRQEYVQNYEIMKEGSWS